MAKHISYNLRDHQTALLAEMTAISLKHKIVVLYEQHAPVKDNDDEEAHNRDE